MVRARILPAAPATSREGRAAEARILHSRGSITPLYRVLLHSPPVAAGWEALLTAIRQKTALSPALRELVILRVAVLNRAPYEFEAHLSHARSAGLTAAKIEAVKGASRGEFAPLEALVLDYTDAMTREVQVPDALFDQVREAFDPTVRVELTATIAAYNMVSRLLAALDVH